MCRGLLSSFFLLPDISFVLNQCCTNEDNDAHGVFIVGNIDIHPLSAAAVGSSLAGYND